MPRMTDPSISPGPIRIADLQVDKSKLKFNNFLVIGCGHLPGRFSRRHHAKFNNWAIGFIAEGAGFYQVNEGPVHKIAKGHLFFVYPDAVFNYGPLKGSSWEEYHVILGGSRISEFEEIGLLLKETVLNVGMNPMWVQKLEVIASLLESGIPANADRASLVCESLLFEFSLANCPAQTDRIADKWSVILEDLACHTYDRVNAELMAKRLNMSVSTLRRIVNQNTGYPLHEFMHRLKMSEAKKLLIHTGTSIKEIALALHYEDVYYFSRLFKKFTGVSAKSYRESM